MTIKVRKSLAWAARNKIQKLWHSNLPNEYKVFLFQYLVEPVLLYGPETWSLTQTTQKGWTGHTRRTFFAGYRTFIGQSMQQRRGFTETYPLFQTL